MKDFKLITAIILSCVLSGQVVLYSQDIRFPEGSCNFGTINEKDGKAVRDFSFQNTRRDTLVICEVTTTCRCVSGEASFKKVPPGEMGIVRLIFDPAYRSGDYVYPVVLKYMDGMASQSIKVKAHVVPMSHPIEEDHPYHLGKGLYSSHKVLPFGSIKSGETKRIFFRFGNGTPEQMDLTFEIEGCLARSIDMEQHFTLAPDERGRVYVSVTMPEGFTGSHINRIWPVVNGVRLETPMLVKATTRN